MKRVLEVTALPGFKLHVVFDDGVAGELDMSHELIGPVYEPLRNPAYFAQVYVDEIGAICWPNGVDIAPDALYLEFTGSTHATGDQKSSSIE